MKTMIDDPRWKEAEELYNAEKWADALSLLNELAEDGITAAYPPIARIYELGYNGKYGQDRGVKENPVEAFKWHTKAYEAGYGLGAVGLARMLIAGNGVERDYEKAFHYLSKARKGHLAEVYRNLGTLYDTGKGVRQDFKKAKLMYMSAIVKGDRMAFFPVGVILTKTGHRAKGYWLMVFGVFQMLMFILRGAWEAGQSNKALRP